MIEQYKKIFMEVFSITEEQLPGLKYQAVESWDSVGHMDLISQIEDSFDIMMDTDDIIAFDSYEKGIELLKKYEVEI